MNISNNNYKKFMELFKLIKCVKNSDENINKINDNKHVNVIEELNKTKLKKKKKRKLLQIKKNLCKNQKNNQSKKPKKSTPKSLLN